MPEQRGSVENSTSGPENPFVVACREYSSKHRDVFLEEIKRFIRAANSTREELAETRKACQSRRQSLRGNRKRGRPLGPKPGSSRNVLNVQAAHHQIDEFESPLNDPHLRFRTDWMMTSDFSYLRPALLQQILLFIADAEKNELAIIRKTVARRASRMSKDRGRPDLEEDDQLLYQCRLVTWRRIIDRKDTQEIVMELCEKKLWKTGIVPPTRNRDGEETHPGNIQTVRGQLWRLENYLAALIWRAVPLTYT